jgi:hypothetical protein
MTMTPKEFFKKHTTDAKNSIDTYRLKQNVYGFLRGRAVNYNLIAPALNTKPAYNPDGSLRVNAFGQPINQPYSSPVPSQGSSPLYDLFAPGPAAGTYKFPSGVPFAITMTSNGHQLNLSMAGSETGVRVLPWGPDACTYMELDAAAEVWFTGPLSGCNIYATGDGAGITVIHANSNQNANDIQQNNKAKRNAALAIASSLGAVKPLWGHLERGSGKYNGLGFVFGQRKGSRWTNYYCVGDGNIHLLS